MSKKKSNINYLKEVREIYLKNRNMILEDFDLALIEVQRTEPSIDGKIANMNYQQFSLKSLFSAIKEQENCINYALRLKPQYVIIDEEKVILKEMIDKVKSIFGKDYEQFYQNS